MSDHHLDEALAFIRDAQLMRQWLDSARTILVTSYADGTMTVALRAGAGEAWGPPTTVRPEGTE